MHEALFGVTLADGRIRCEVCPRRCELHVGQRGLCFVRMHDGGRLVLTTYGRTSGIAVDPIEKKPLYHFLPGSRVLSFGTAGCNLTCRFCQNWDISKSRSTERLGVEASPAMLALLAEREGCPSVAFTYNDPIIFLEYAVDTAAECHARGIRTVAVTAGYVLPAARRLFYAAMDAANVDLKGFSERFYHDVCGASLAAVQETLVYLVHETGVWTEITTLLIPGENDSDDEVRALCAWVVRELGADVPLHFTAFHPDWRMREHAPTPRATLERARAIGLRAGLRYVYTGNVRDREGGTTWCHACGAALIVREGYDVEIAGLDAQGCCAGCGRPCVGVF